MSINQNIINILYKKHFNDGFVEENYLHKLFIENNIELTDVEKIIGKLLDLGVVVKDNSEFANKSKIDKAKSDYSDIYRTITKISPNQAFFVSFVQSIIPPQNNEWIQLVQQNKSGNLYAQKRLFEMYLRFVLKIALKYHKKRKIHLDDAIQEGLIGLLVGLTKFDLNKHNKIQSYLVSWIYQKIDRAVIDQEPTIRIPVHAYQFIKRLNYEISYYVKTFGKIPNNKHLSKVLETPLKKIDTLTKVLPKCKSFEDLIECIEIDSTFYSENEERFLSDIYVKLLREDLLKAFSFLKSKEVTVIVYRFGFFNQDKHTLEEVGFKLNVTRERVRQIEKKALEKLRNIDYLKEWL